jgi:hypothetical protein
VRGASLLTLELNSPSLGRSSGKGSFAIWTHNLKGKEWHSSFVAKGAPEGTPGVKAVTLQAGEQWLGMGESLSTELVPTDLVHLV